MHGILSRLALNELEIMYDIDLTHLNGYRGHRRIPSKFKVT